MTDTRTTTGEGNHMLLAEELLLIALDDEHGSSANHSLAAGLSGALLTDLGRAGALRSGGKLLHPVSGDGLEPLLRRSYAVLAASSRPRTAKAWLPRLSASLRPIRATVAAGLVERGVLAERRGGLLGALVGPRFPQVDAEPERQLLQRLRTALTTSATPDEHDALLLGLLTPLGLVDRLVVRGERSAARRRAKAIADAGTSGPAVHAVVQEVRAATIAAVAGAGAAAS